MGVGGSLLLFLVAATISLATSWFLVSRLERVGERLGLTEALLGLLAALAANTPEITSSITAIVNNQRDVGAGVIIGSNVFNLAALLGLGAIVAGRIDLHRRVVLLAGSVALWVAVVCLASISGAVAPGVGLALCFVVFGPYVAVLAMRRRHLDRVRIPERWASWVDRAVVEEELELEDAIRPTRGRPVDTLVAVASLVIVVLASIVMERSATTLGVHFAIPGLIVGGVILAAVTSLPNAVAAIYLAARGRGAAMLSTALNSNSLNVLLGLLLPAVIVGLARPTGAATLVGSWYVGLTVVTLVLAYLGRGLRRWAGCLIVALYLAFVAVLFAIT